MGATYRTGPNTRGFGLGRVAGIELFVDASVAIIFALVAFGLGADVLPRWHPEWSSAVRWTVALGAAVAFFASILLHELSHALVGRAFGLVVPRITLFVFGGLAHLQGEPTTPKAELLMAIVGPITSIVIGVGSMLLGLAWAGGFGSVDVEGATLVLREANPIATVLLWLGPINVALGVFNLVPGFPLDGGRVLRAALWWTTGDFEEATRYASWGGRLVGSTLVALGVVMAFGVRVPFLGVGLANGLWLALIGWFLQNAARASYEQLRLRGKLSHVAVRDLMRTEVDIVDPRISVAELVSEHVMKSDQTSFPVVHEGELVGMVSTRDVRLVPHAHWVDTSVANLMSPSGVLPSVEIDADASKALETLAATDVEQLPITDHGRLRGFVRRQDILKWLTLQPDAVNTW